MSKSAHNTIQNHFRGGACSGGLGRRGKSTFILPGGVRKSATKEAVCGLRTERSKGFPRDELRTTCTRESMWEGGKA